MTMWDLGAGAAVAAYVAMMVLLIRHWNREDGVTPRKKPKPTTPERMSYAELLAYSARLDHEIWPDETDWNHPASCSACRPHSGVQATSAAAHQVMAGHEPDWQTTYVECRQLGKPEPYYVPGQRTCRRCKQADLDEKLRRVLGTTRL